MGTIITGYSRSVDAWEYCVECMFDDSSVGTFEADLDRLGRKGWELVSVVGRPAAGVQFHAFLKRPSGFAQVEHDVAGHNL